MNSWTIEMFPLLAHYWSLKMICSLPSLSSIKIPYKKMATFEEKVFKKPRSSIQVSLIFCADSS
jgi:hypothetical protein